MPFSKYGLVSVLLGAFAQTTTAAAAADVNAGFNAYEAAQVMVEKASHSWEWGTAAEALLELYNPDLSVFGPNPFPGGNVPKADPGTLALSYARQFINRNSDVLVGDSAVGDPASLGVSAILLGQSDGTYIGAAQRQADYLLNGAPRYSNGAISHRPDVAELWADNVAMSFPFLAYLAVQQNNASLMAEAVRQCGLYRDVLKTSQALNWQHIVGPQSPDAGLWSTGNGWASFGMVRVLHTLQRWSGSSSMTSQAGQLKSWIKEILDGAMLSGFDNDGLLHNYLNDASWFGEISGTALLSAVAYRMAVNDPSAFPQKYVAWADTNRKALAKQEGGDGVFAPAVNPYNWKDQSEYNSGSPEGQAFAVFLYTAYRDCVGAGVCGPPPSSATTISHPGIGPIDIITALNAPITFSAMPDPTGTICASPQSCDADGCAGAFSGLVKYPSCTAGSRKGCRCTATATTCGAHQSCDLNGCAGKFNGLTKYAQCTGNFEGCECTATATTCGAHQSCDLNGCAGKFSGLTKYAQCTGNFEGCECTASSTTCGAHQSCDLNGCAGKFDGSKPYAQCTGNFEGCECTATATACGAHQSCDLNGCAGKFNGLQPYAQCTGNFIGCECSPTTTTCGSPQSCDLNGCAGTFSLSDGKAYCSKNFVGCACASTPRTCGGRQSCDKNNCQGAFAGSNKAYAQCTNFFRGCDCDATPATCGSPQSCGLNGCGGAFDLADGKAYCTNNFVGCECAANPATCGAPQSCDLNNCKGGFPGNVPTAQCTGFFKGCQCKATATTCGPNKQSCDLNGCAGGYDAQGVARCQGNFQGCACNPTAATCNAPQNCDLNGCNGSFDSNSNTARCRGKFAGCVCKPVKATCGTPKSCSLNGCNGAFDANANAVCMGNFYGCQCIPDPIWIPPPPQHTDPPPPTQHESIVMISLASQIVNNQASFWWSVFNINGVFLPGGLCNVSPLVTTSSGTQPFPQSMPSFNVESFSNCRYSGSKSSEEEEQEQEQEQEDEDEPTAADTGETGKPTLKSSSSSSPHAAAAMAFRLFSDLPPEIRHLIWLATLPPDGRVFHVSGCSKVAYANAHRNPEEDWLIRDWHPAEPSERAFDFYVRHAPPLATQICRESRAAALSSGCFFFLAPSPSSSSSSLSSPVPAAARPSPGAWFNPRRDMLYLDRNMRHRIIKAASAAEPRRMRVRGMDRVLHVGVEWRAWFRDIPRLREGEDMRPQWRAAMEPLLLYFCPRAESLGFVLPRVRHVGGVTFGREPYGAAQYPCHLAPLPDGIQVPWEKKQRRPQLQLQLQLPGGANAAAAAAAAAPAVPGTAGLALSLTGGGGGTSVLTEWRAIRREMEAALESLRLGRDKGAEEMSDGQGRVLATQGGGRRPGKAAPVVRGWWLLRAGAPTNYEQQQVQEFLS
ncbi:FAD-binding, type 2 [Purpureocillium lavendulum]|uniref:FAD-binding, type 2 n=1 Tax=Purpureocillium lavendulum TaxID=1247861 RepID=A0AB34FDF4_9HYPO|nr:FAD-binding, type 2 [Purpureocillium lavendulum]